MGLRSLAAIGSSRGENAEVLKEGNEGEHR